MNPLPTNDFATFCVVGWKILIHRVTRSSKYWHISLYNVKKSRLILSISSEKALLSVGKLLSSQQKLKFYHRQHIVVFLGVTGSRSSLVLCHQWFQMCGILSVPWDAAEPLQFKEVPAKCRSLSGHGHPFKDRW